MTLASRDAQVVWEGTLAGGRGQVTTGSGSPRELPLAWASTSQEADGASSPEELLAAAEAGCYAMSLALGLQRRGHEPERLSVRCVCELDKHGDGEGPEYEVTRLALEVRARVPGLDEPGFREIAERSDRDCPISIAVRGAVEVHLDARLEG